MLEMIKRKIVTKRPSEYELSAKLWEKLLLCSHHDWIREDARLLRSFALFIRLLDFRALSFLSHSSKQLIYLKANGKLSCALSTVEDGHITLIFPELERYLKSAAPEFGLAILAHELGHILNEHHKRKLTPLLAQFEADQYAAQIGLGAELIEILQEFPDSEECRERIKNLRKQ